MTTTRLIAMASLYLAAFCQCCLLDSREDAPNRRSPGRRCGFRSGRVTRYFTGRGPGLVASAEDWLLAL